MDQTLLEYILQDTFTKTFALKKVIALKDYLLTKIFSSPKQTSEENNITEDPEITIWVANLDPAVYSWINPQNIYEIFENLEKSIKAIEPLMLYLPHEIPLAYITEIGQKLRADYGKSFLMDIHIDPNLIAGPALSYRGFYRDYSVKQKIMDNRQEVLSTFRKYIKH